MSEENDDSNTIIYDDKINDSIINNVKKAVNNNNSMLNKTKSDLNISNINRSKINPNDSNITQTYKDNNHYLDHLDVILSNNEEIKDIKNDSNFKSNNEYDESIQTSVIINKDKSSHESYIGKDQEESLNNELRNSLLNDKANTKNHFSMYKIMNKNKTNTNADIIKSSIQDNQNISFPDEILTQRRSISSQISDSLKNSLIKIKNNNKKKDSEDNFYNDNEDDEDSFYEDEDEEEEEEESDIGQNKDINNSSNSGSSDKKQYSEKSDDDEEESEKEDDIFIEFPDFYKIDEIDFFETFREDKEDKNNKKEKENYDYTEIKTFVDDNNIKELFSEDFEININQLLYKHRDKVYEGRILSFNKKPIPCMIKRIEIINKDMIVSIYNELNIIVTLSQENMFSFQGINFKLDENIIYLFFEHRRNWVSLEDFSKLEYLIDNEEDNNPCNDKFYLVIRNLLKTVLKLHTKGIIHRDIREDMFYLDERLNIKVFDFYNSISVNVLSDIVDDDVRKRNLINELHNSNREKILSIIENEMNKEKYKKSNVENSSSIFNNNFYTNINMNNNNSLNNNTNKQSFIKTKTKEKLSSGVLNNNNTKLEQEKSINNNILHFNSNTFLKKSNITNKNQLFANLPLSKVNTNKMSIASGESPYLNNLCNLEIKKSNEISNILKLNPDEFNQFRTKTMKSLLLQSNDKSKDFFYTPKYVCAELGIVHPKIGWSQDIFALCCVILFMFLNYSKYEESVFQVLLYRVFNADNNNYCPKIPKYIKNSVAVCVNYGFKADPLKRLDIIELINKFNNYIFKNKVYFEINYETKDSDDDSNDKNNNVNNIKEENDDLSNKSQISYSNDESNNLINNKTLSIVITDEDQSNIASLKNVNIEMYKEELLIPSENDNIYNKILIEEDQTENNISNTNTPNTIQKEQTNIVMNNNNNNNSEAKDTTKDNTYNFEYCEFHQKKNKNFFCDKCKNFYCEFCIRMSHNDHLYTNIEHSLEVSEKVLIHLIKEIEEKFIDTNYLIIKQIKQKFEDDYEKEKNSIISNYDHIIKQVVLLQQKQIENLEKSKNDFLKNGFQKLFEDSHKMMQLYYEFYEVKSKYESVSTRFMNMFRLKRLKKQKNLIKNKNSNNYISVLTNKLKDLQDNNLLPYRFLNNKFSNNTIQSYINSNYFNEMNAENFLSIRNCFDMFDEYCDSYHKISDYLIDKSLTLKVPGKYIFRSEQYSNEILKSIKAVESNIKSEKLKTFDYFGNDTLSLSKEILMVIPLTDCVFSYSKNVYKKYQVNFLDNNIKVSKFLPGCASTHLKNYFFITGGEINDEGTIFCYCCKIEDKVIDEIAELNYKRRYHTMVNLLDRFLCVIGGWESKEVEIINIGNDTYSYWNTLPSMINYRSDCSVFLSNRTWLYVFGGWEYVKKECVYEVERYLLFSNSNDFKERITPNFKNNWEVVKIKFNKVYLQKYNMGLIPLLDEFNDVSEKLLFVGGFDEEYNYSASIVKAEINLKDGSLTINKDVIGLPIKEDKNFWHENSFHIMENFTEKEAIAVNPNCFNQIYVYFFQSNLFKLYTSNFEGYRAMSSMYNGTEPENE